MTPRIAPQRIATQRNATRRARMQREEERRRAEEEARYDAEQRKEAAELEREEMQKVCLRRHARSSSVRGITRGIGLSDFSFPEFGDSVVRTSGRTWI